MASSGSFSTSAYGVRYLTFEWGINSQDINANKTSVWWRLVGSGAGSPGYYTSGNFYVTVDGVQRYYSATRINLYNGTVVASGSCDIYHNGDGTRSFSAYAEAGIYTGAVNCWGSGSWSLTTIPRASNFTLSPSSLYATGENLLSVTITPLISGASHDVKYEYGSYSYTASGVGTYTAYAIPKDWIRDSPNVATGSGQVTVTTKNGGTAIGSKSAIFYISAPLEVVPTIGDIQVTRIDNDAPPTWGVYVQNHSAVKLDVTGASGAYGSTIAKYEIKSTDFSSATATLTTGKLPGAGGYIFTATVTDSRGRTATKTVTIQVEPYDPPSITDSRVDRCLPSGTLSDDGAYAFAQVGDMVSSVSGKNVVTRKIEYRRVGGYTWTDGGSYAAGGETVFGAGLISVDYSHEVRITLQDLFSAVSVTVALPTAYTTVDYRAGGKGIAFGKVAESDGLDVAMGARFREDVTFDQVPRIFYQGRYVDLGEYINILIEENTT